jgi:hypothetical protein
VDALRGAVVQDPDRRGDGTESAEDAVGNGQVHVARQQPDAAHDVGRDPAGRSDLVAPHRSDQPLRARLQQVR